VARDDTTFEAAAAELLVVGMIMIEGIQAFRAYGNQPGYDVMVINPKTQKSLKVQVKSRVAVDSGQFKIGNTDFDFVVFVRLNRGTKAERKGASNEVASKRAPEFFVVPRAALLEAVDADNDAMSGVRLVNGDVVIARREFSPGGWCVQNFQDRWELIYDAIGH
jgi:hypothetical protein